MIMFEEIECNYAIIKLYHLKNFYNFGWQHKAARLL